MSADYRSMWADLGLDLEAHDTLLGVLGQAYQDIYLAQRNRPEGMGYFDFVMSEVHGLRIKELLDEKTSERKIIGSYCVFVPEEIVLAANATLVGLCSGADFATEDVEKLLPRNTCALIKSSFGFRRFPGKHSPHSRVRVPPGRTQLETAHDRGNRRCSDCQRAIVRGRTRYPQPDR